MTRVRLRGPLKQLAGEIGEHEVEGATVLDVLRGLERRHPALAGWILDERGSIRRHVNVFVNGERAEEGSAVGDGARMEILPAISGGTTAA